MQWKHVAAAFMARISQIATLKPEKASSPKDKQAGNIYVLHDGVTGLSKIGCTGGEGPGAAPAVANGISRPRVGEHIERQGCSYARR
jgi:hypothetical protein